MGELVLVLGGARSGKSRFAQQLASEAGERVVYVATSQIWDDEMAERVRRHQSDRPAHWRTVEEPLALVETVAVKRTADAILVDCLTLWLTNRLFPGEEGHGTDLEAAAMADLERAIMDDLEQLADAAAAGRARVIVVSNEVGQGIVPEYPLGRFFRDLQGRANQALAARADRVFVTWAGIPVEIKALQYRGAGK